MPDAGTSTAAYLRWWVAELLPGTVRSSTATDYRWILEHYVIPQLGAVPLGLLSPLDVHGMLRALEAAGRSARTRQYARAVLRRALGRAQRFGLIERNVAALVDGPRLRNAALHDTLTATEAACVLAAARGDRLEGVAVLALRLGLRKGELLGLRWGDVDLDNRTVRVTGTLKRHPGGGLFVD